MGGGRGFDLVYFTADVFQTLVTLSAKRRRMFLDLSSELRFQISLSTSEREAQKNLF